VYAGVEAGNTSERCWRLGEAMKLELVDRDQLMLVLDAILVAVVSQGQPGTNVSFLQNHSVSLK
jgi:hypothetical protein